jgi:WD40 repeat protein
LTFNHFITV